jgi:hypothetical protein
MKKLSCLAAVALLAAGCTGGISHYPTQNNEAISSENQLNRNQSDPNIKTYFSKNLGVQFQYYAFDGGGPSDQIHVKEDENFIFLYDTDQPSFDLQGPDRIPQFMQVFGKDPRQSLFDAVSQKLELSKYPQCKNIVNPNISSEVDLQGPDAETDGCPNVLYNGYTLDNYQDGFFKEDVSTHARYYFVPKYQDAFQAGPPIPPSQATTAQYHDWIFTIHFQ